ncbi:hypothetical protein T03_4416 [Trichinella britovi]|uniref:Uncharacterized protein n=1 Tax=Trichinella britovi TaxID=45882 RepID=A0A0V1C6T9_TRIBR|nr:hypothetical protein T03_4416 [Trichinella britovi]
MKQLNCIKFRIYVYSTILCVQINFGRVRNVKKSRCVRSLGYGGCEAEEEEKKEMHLFMRYIDHMYYKRWCTPRVYFKGTPLDISLDLNSLKQIVTTTTKLHLRITGGGLAFPADVA